LSQRRVFGVNTFECRCYKINTLQLLRHIK
jgi:hypothetical protein